MYPLYITISGYILASDSTNGFIFNTKTVLKESTMVVDSLGIVVQIIWSKKVLIPTFQT